MAGGKHGGAWKVAYADFVTAMMALFLVLWLTAQDTKIKESVERAFRHPFASPNPGSSGLVENKEASSVKKTEGKFDAQAAFDAAMLRRLNEDLAKLLQPDNEADKSIEIELTADGLRVNVFDRSQRPIFESDSVRFTDYGSWVFSTLAWEIARFQTFRIELEGHTEAGKKEIRENYGEFELSADRANSTRRHLIKFGVQPEQIGKVVGLGSTLPMAGAAPTSEMNRRITVLVRLRAV